MYSQGYVPQNQGPDRNNRPAYGQPQQNWYAPGPQQGWQPPQSRSAQPDAVRRRSSSGHNGGENTRQDKPSEKPGKKRSLKWQLIKCLLFLLVLAGLGVGGYFWTVQKEVEPYADVFLPNVYVDGLCLDGMTWEEGYNAVWQQVNTKRNAWYVRLKNAAGEYKDITADMLGISFDPTAALEAAWAVGHNVDPQNPKNMFQLRDEIRVAKTTTYSFSSAEQSADTAPIDTILTTLQTAAYRPAQNAALVSFNPDDMYNPFTFQPEVYGQYLDITAVKEEILGMVNTFTSGEVMLELTPIVPEITVEKLQKSVELRYRAVTPISSDSTPERTANIEVAFSKINGLRLENGKKFSFNKLVGRRNDQNGFHQAIEYAYGQEILGWGGGVCQASTTVYLAAVQAGLKINHREAHSNPVSYTQMGMDATVSDTRGREIDFTFTNDTGGDIYISAHVITSSNGRSKLCEVRIYGPSLENVSYMLESKTIETLPKPLEPELKEDETATYVIYQDETKKYSTGRDGYVVETYLVTYIDGQEVDRVKLHRDTYPERPDRYWVGITPR